MAQPTWTSIEIGVKLVDLANKYTVTKKEGMEALLAKDAATAMAKIQECNAMLKEINELKALQAH